MWHRGLVPTTMRRSRHWAAAALVVAVLATGTAFAAPQPHRSAFQVTGYASDWTDAG